VVQTVALPGIGQSDRLAEGAGFEPAMELPPYTLSRRAPSTTRPPLHDALISAARPADTSQPAAAAQREAAAAPRGRLCAADQRNKLPYLNVSGSVCWTEAEMPLLLLWVGIPVVLFGGGYAVIHYLH
jgi:hypothetical protein